MTYKRKSIESVGLDNWLEELGINPAEFKLYVDRGARQGRLLEIYKDKVANWRTITKWLNQLARERGLDDYHDLYV